MPSAKAIKGQLAFVKSMQKLIEALKEIDAAHFQSLAKAKMDKFEKFEDVIKDFLKLAEAVSLRPGITCKLLKQSNVRRSGIIVLSSDASFMGKLNTEVCKAALALIDELGDCEAIVLGKKGHIRLRYVEAKITPLPGIQEKTRYEQVVQLKEYVLKQRLSEEIGDLWLIAPKTMGFGKQEIHSIKLLPAFDFAKLKDEVVLEKWQEVCIESNIENIMTYLVDTWLMSKLLDYAYESKLAEYSARTTHLEGSLDYLKNQIKQLSLSYNKARQGEVDTGMRETFAALMGSSV